MIFDYMMDVTLDVLKWTVIGLGFIYGAGILLGLVAVVWIIINEKKERKNK